MDRVEQRVMRLQVRVRHAADAALAVRVGVRHVELVETAPLEVVRATVARLRLMCDDAVISAGPAADSPDTPGEAPVAADVLYRARRLADCQVDLVRVPVSLHDSAASALLLTRLGKFARDGLPAMPVFRLPGGASVGTEEAAALRRLVSLASRQHFKAVMIDITALTGAAGGLWGLRTVSAHVQGLMAQLQRNGVQVGLSSAPRLADLPQLRRWAPDFAVIDCWQHDPAEGRAFDEQRLEAWLQAQRRLDTAPQPGALPDEPEA